MADALEKLEAAVRKLTTDMTEVRAEMKGFSGELKGFSGELRGLAKAQAEQAEALAEQADALAAQSDVLEDLVGSVKQIQKTQGALTNAMTSAIKQLGADKTLDIRVRRLEDAVFGSKH